MLLDQHLFDTLLQAAAVSPRRRAFHNLHQDFAEPVQRVLIAMQPDSYVPPHQHVQSHQWELFVVLNGQVDFLQFAADGTLCERRRLAAGSSLTGIELPAGHWHTVVASGGPAVFLEIKQGPFDPQQPRHFADFAPQEQTAAAVLYQQWLQQAQTGSRYQEQQI